MNDIFYEMIFKRKSFHIFRNVGNESIGEYEHNDIQKAYSAFTPLNPEIKTAIRMIPEKETNCRRGGEYCILLYSERKDGYSRRIPRSRLCNRSGWRGCDLGIETALCYPCGGRNGTEQPRLPTGP